MCRFVGKKLWMSRNLFEDVCVCEAIEFVYLLVLFYLCIVYLFYSSKFDLVLLVCVLN